MAEYVSNGPAGRAIQAIGAIIALIIVFHILFVLIGANPGNTIVHTDADWAAWFAAWFKDLFTPSSYRLAVVVNYGLAALFYLVVGRVLAALVDAL